MESYLALRCSCHCLKHEKKGAIETESKPIFLMAADVFLLPFSPPLPPNKAELCDFWFYWYLSCLTSLALKDALSSKDSLWKLLWWQSSRHAIGWELARRRSWSIVQLLSLKINTVQQAIKSWKVWLWGSKEGWKYPPLPAAQLTWEWKGKPPVRFWRMAFSILSRACMMGKAYTTWILPGQDPGEDAGCALVES